MVREQVQTEQETSFDLKNTQKPNAVSTPRSYLRAIRPERQYNGGLQEVAPKCG